jgi:hypothetical protein
MTRPLLALLAVAALATAAPVPKAKNNGPAYPTAVGTKCEYIHNGDEKAVCVEEITKADEKDGVVTIRVDIKMPGGTKTFEEFEIKGSEVWCRVSGGSKCDPPNLMFKGGVKARDTWENKYKLGGEQVKETVTVGEAEEITTPAGTFTATALVHVVSEPKGSQAYTAWFVEGVGLIRHTYDGEKAPFQELKSFTPAAAKK